jgi:hypothetical protein
MNRAAQGYLQFSCLSSEALQCLLQQGLQRASRKLQGLQTVLIALEIQQVIDQSQQAVHLRGHGIQEVSLAGLGGELQARLQQ